MRKTARHERACSGATDCNLIANLERDFAAQDIGYLVAVVCMCIGVSVLAGATSSNIITLAAVSPVSILRAADLPGAIFHTLPCPGGTTKPFVSINIFSLVGCLVVGFARPSIHLLSVKHWVRCPPGFLIGSGRWTISWRSSMRPKASQKTRLLQSHVRRRAVEPQFHWVTVVSQWAQPDYAPVPMSTARGRESRRAPGEWDGMARRCPPRKVTYFEPARPRLAHNPIIESTFGVGRRLSCTMRVDCG